MGQLPLDPLDQRVERARWPDQQPARARPQPLRLVVRVGRRRRRFPRPGRDRHRDGRLDPLPGRCLRRRRDEADARPAQRRGHRAHLGGAGHPRPDGALGGRRRPHRVGAGRTTCGAAAPRLPAGRADRGLAAGDELLRHRRAHGHGHRRAEGCGRRPGRRGPAGYRRRRRPRAARPAGGVPA